MQDDAAAAKAAAKAALEEKEDEEAMARGFIAIVRHLRAHAATVDAALEAEKRAKATALQLKAKEAKARTDSAARQPQVAEVPKIETCGCLTCKNNNNPRAPNGMRRGEWPCRSARRSAMCRLKRRLRATVARQHGAPKPSFFIGSVLRISRTPRCAVGTATSPTMHACCAGSC